MTWSRTQAMTAGPARVAVAALLAVGLAACQGDGEEAAPRRVTLSAATTTAAAGQGLQPLPAGGPLEPAGYRTTAFEPAASFRVALGWEVPEAETPGAITLGRDVDSTAPFEGRYLTFLRVGQVFANPLLTDEQLAGNQGKYLRPVPADLVGWLRSHPYLETSTPKKVRIGGLAGLRVDATVKDLPAQPDTCVDANPRQCVFLFPFPDSRDVWNAFAASTIRYVVLDSDGPPLVIAVEAPEKERAAFLAQAEKVLATVSFG
jgi:hypothetical protein